MDEEDGVAVELQTGQASLHHGHLFTPRDPTAPAIATSARQFATSSLRCASVTGERWMFRMTSGSDRYGHFDLADLPRGRLHEADFERCRHDVAVRRRLFYAGADPDRSAPVLPDRLLH